MLKSYLVYIYMLCAINMADYNWKNLFKNAIHEQGWGVAISSTFLLNELVM